MSIYGKLTKAQLIEKYEELETNHYKTCDELHRLKELQEHKEGAEELKLIYDDLVAAGFEEEFAKEVFIGLANAGRLPDVFYSKFVPASRAYLRPHNKVSY